MAANILVVGEEKGIAESLQMAMGQSGYLVIAAEAQATEETIYHQWPTLIVVCMSDCEMADLDLCRRLFNIGDAPIIAIGSPQDMECRLAAFDAGVDDYLIRPVNLQELMARVRNILRRKLPSGQ